MRKKRLAYNTISSLIYQIVSIICGFVLPRLVLKHYGSETNGLVNSITQFLQIITFLDLGVGSVVQSALYKPLAEKNNIQIGRIINSANLFFRRIAKVLVFYILGLCVFYPIAVKNDYSAIYTILLILAIGISIFSESYIGVVDRLLLLADQRGYVQYVARIVTIIVNTILCSIFISLDASIQIVKFTTSAVFLLRPIILRLYVNRHYSFNRKEPYSEEPIRQKWNGIAQHIAAVVLDQTDIIVLTTFSTLTNVSIYSVYHLVIYGVKNILWATTNGIQSLLGELIAKKEEDNLKRVFQNSEWVLHTATTFVFSCTAILIIPFVRIYTHGINDAEYIQPLFAVLITCAHAIHCLRLPYNILILAAGHYKQTQSNYIVAALMNIIISILAVNSFGLIGVAIGTLCSMLYQTVWMAIYDSKNILHTNYKQFIKQFVVDACSVIIIAALSSFVHLKDISIISFVVLSIEVAFISAITIIIVNSVFYRNKVKAIMNKILRMIKIILGGVIKPLAIHYANSSNRNKNK